MTTKQTPEEKAKAAVAKAFHALVQALNDDAEFSVRAQRLHEAWERSQKAK